MARTLSPARPATRALADEVLRRSPVQVAFRLVAGRRLAVLAYHGVDDPARFAEHLDQLLEVACPVSLERVLSAVDGGQALPKRSVLVTFDDGHRSVLELGLPLLVERGIPAVAFVVTALLDTDRPFWWSELQHLVCHGGRVAGEPIRTPAGWIAHLKTVPDSRRRDVMDELRATASHEPPPFPQLRGVELALLVQAGVAIGNHTASHPCLDRCSDSVVRHELVSAHEVLTQRLGAKPTAFAYPNGNWDGRAERLLRDKGYRLAFLFDHALNRSTLANGLRLSRLRIGTEASSDRLATILSGLHPALHRARGGA